jgi:hypothetical protein
MLLIFCCQILKLFAPNYFSGGGQSKIGAGNWVAVKADK